MKPYNHKKDAIRAAMREGLAIAGCWGLWYVGTVDELKAAGMRPVGVTGKADRESRGRCRRE